VHDQSYFLYALTQARLDHALFPVGEMTKAQVRAVAERRGLPVADKPGSQDICFVGAGGYRAYLAGRIPDLSGAGPILDVAGRVIGQHRGLAGYTIGQRSGLGIAWPEPLYVTGLDPGRNALVVGPWRETLATSLELFDVRWHAGDPPAVPRALAVKVRYRGPEARATVQVIDTGARVTWLAPQRLVAPGQAVVFYDGDRILGGGTALVAGQL
jgi:tRNA-specific 2-thiouridylase